MPGPFAQLFRTGDLESASDHEYERLRARASARAGDSATVFAWCAGIGLAIVWAGGGVAMAAVVAGLTRPAGAAVVPADNFGRVWSVNVAFALVAGFVAARLVFEWRLSKAMHRLQNKAGCPYCEFSLVGLKPELGAVTCPECGQMVVLAEHHIAPDALFVPGSGPPVSNAGPLGSFQGEVPKGKDRRIRRMLSGIPNRQVQQAATRPDAPGGGEFLSE